MPSKYIVRNLKENCTYHIFNSGASEKGLFLDNQDYRVFAFYLYIYTSPAEKVIHKFSDLPGRLRDKTLAGKLDILAYTLFPDHFHLIVYQKEIDGLPRLLKQVVNGYTVYYNQKYHHKGPVFWGRYKAMDIPNEDLLDVVRYIHREPVEKGLTTEMDEFEWTSYQNYLKQEAFLECDTTMVMEKFGTVDNFRTFCENKGEYDQRLGGIKQLIIE